MIKFLREENGDRDGIIRSGMETKHLGERDDPWTIQPFSYPRRSSRAYFDRYELCDARWPAVKEALEDAPVPVE
jgi:hypothetical protein